MFLWWWKLRSQSSDFDVQRHAARKLGASRSPRAIPTLIKLLDRGLVNEVAAEALTRIGRAAVEPLLNFVLRTDCDSPQKKNAINALVTIGDERAIGAVIDHLINIAIRATDPFKRSQAIWTLQEIGVPRLNGNWTELPAGEWTKAPPYQSRVSDALLGSLDELDPERAQLALQALSLMGQSVSVTKQESIAKRQWQQAIDILRTVPEQTREGRSTRVHEPAIEFLAKAPASVACRPLFEFYCTPFGGVYLGKKCEEVLRQFGSAAVDEIVSYLHDSHWQVRQTACRLLAKLGDARAVEPLLEMLRDPQRRNKDTVHALEKFHDPRSVEPLIDFLCSSSDQLDVMSCIQLLGELGDRRAVRPIMRMLRNGGGFVIKASSNVDPLANAHLFGGLDDAIIGSVSISAANALSKLGDPTAIDALRAALDGTPRTDRGVNEFSAVKGALARLEPLLVGRG